MIVDAKVAASMIGAGPAGGVAPPLAVGIVGVEGEGDGIGDLGGVRERLVGILVATIGSKVSGSSMGSGSSGPGGAEDELGESNLPNQEEIDVVVEGAVASSR